MAKWWRRWKGKSRRSAQSVAHLAVRHELGHLDERLAKIEREDHGARRDGDALLPTSLVQLGLELLVETLGGHACALYAYSEILYRIIKNL